MSDRIGPGPYLVVGAGRAGIAAAHALAARVAPSRITIWDAHDGPETRERCAGMAQLGVAVELGPWRAPLVPAPGSVVVKSPGVAPGSPPIAAALHAGLTVIDELALGLALTERPFVAVTGTDGKSTVCALLARALGAPDVPLPVVGNTEFGPPLSAAAATGRPLVLECSSYQLEFSSRPRARLAVLTNLTDNHLSRHRTMRAYGAAKRRLFVGDDGVVPRAVIHGDDAFGAALARELRAAGAAVATFGSSAGVDYRVAAARWDAHGAQVELDTPSGAVAIATRLPGRHNAQNVTAALAACDLLAVPRDRTLSVLSAASGVPGRWELIDGGQPFDVVVDFAHTPAALRHVLVTARRVAASRPGACVHLVLGAGGGFDRRRRAPLGEVAAAFADRVTLTSSNPRGEPVRQSISDLVARWPDDRAAPAMVPDRREAIRAALVRARRGDVVIVAGRGVMPRLLVNQAGGGPPFDDRVVAREELAALAGAQSSAAKKCVEGRASAPPSTVMSTRSL
jgi:UDP-N-acetylmuramoyl-L-alanyl-D-glutamate--2,6-diaminopimelate ligase